MKNIKINVKRKLALSIGLALLVTQAQAAGPAFTGDLSIKNESPDIEFIDDDANDADWEICIDDNGCSTLGATGISQGFHIGSKDPATGNIALQIENGAGTATLPAVTIDSAGRVGINNENPTEELEINSTRPAVRLNDTSGGAFDYNLVADSSNFVIEDAGGNNILFIEGNKTSTPLWLDSDGDVGIQVANPIADLQVGGGGEILLENGTEDYVFQVDSSAFRIRRGNNTLSGIAPFIMEDGAGTNSLVIDDTGKIGLGTTTPASFLSINRFGADILVKELSAVAMTRQLVNLENKGGIGIRMNNTNNSSIWDFTNTDAGNFAISKVGSGGFDFEVEANGRTKIRSFGTLNFDMRANGDLHIPEGDVFVGGTKLNVPDYVFEHNYKLMPLDELQAFIAEKKHLPNVPSEADIKKAKLLNIGKTQMTHLEKIEELTLYTLQQHKQIKALKATSGSLQKKLDEQTMALKTKNELLQERLASLEKLVTNLASANALEGKGKSVALK